MHRIPGKKNQNLMLSLLSGLPLVQHAYQWWKMGTWWQNVQRNDGRKNVPTTPIAFNIQNRGFLEGNYSQILPFVDPELEWKVEKKISYTNAPGHLWSKPCWRARWCILLLMETMCTTMASFLHQAWARGSNSKRIINFQGCKNEVYLYSFLILAIPFCRA